jgi:serine/threonine protein kinase
VIGQVALTDASSRRRFENEVNILWKLQHPAIITVEAVFYETLRAYIQMPYISGGTLRLWLQVSTL